MHISDPDPSAVASTESASAEPTDPREARIKELEQELTVQSFRQVLTDAQSRSRADRLLEQFQRGTLTYANWKRLPAETQQLYKNLHGKVPMNPDEVRAKQTARVKRSTKNKMAKKSRRRNRS